jgi:hypothetical protein
MIVRKSDCLARRATVSSGTAGKAEAFPIILKNVGHRYMRAYRFKNILIASMILIFVAPFLSLIRLEFVYLTLVPWTLAGSIIIYNYVIGGAPSLRDPIGLRDGCIEVDRYPSFAAILHDDRFIELESIKMAEVELFVESTLYKRGGRPKPRAEMRRITLYGNVGRRYTIERESWIIRNAVKALDAWNEARQARSSSMFLEEKVEIAPIYCDIGQLGGGRSSGPWVKYFLLIMVLGLTGILLYLLYYAASSHDGTDDPAMFLFLCIVGLITIILMLFRVFSELAEGFAAPENARPLTMLVQDQGISIRFLDERNITFPWSSLRGAMATPTDDYPHPFTMDHVFFDPQWGILVFDRFLIYVRMTVVNMVQSTYERKFGFYPHKFWLKPGHQSYSDNFAQVVRQPKKKTR